MEFHWSYDDVLQTDNITDYSLMHYNVMSQTDHKRPSQAAVCMYAIHSKCTFV